MGSSGGIARRMMPILRSAGQKEIWGADLVESLESTLDAFFRVDLLSLTRSDSSSLLSIRSALSQADSVIVLAAAVHNPTF